VLQNTGLQSVPDQPEWCPRSTGMVSQIDRNGVPDQSESVSQIDRNMQVIIKIRGNAPQKLQKTQFHRCKNLDGVFEIQGRMLKGPVLLVDDVVNSRWTLTVGSVLLRRAGSDKVYPFALATSSKLGL